MKANSLVLFSVLSQAAVGTSVVSALLPGAPAARLALPLAALGLIVSLAHLGTPLGAVRALANLRSSWLSREVLLTSLFTAAAGVYGYLSPTPAAGITAGLLGIAALLAQGMVYQLPTRREWRHGSNLWGLIASAVLIGALTVALAGPRDREALRLLGYIILAGAAGVLTAQAAWAIHLRRTATLAGDTWFWIRLVAGAILPALAGVGLLLGMVPDVLTTGGALAGAVIGELLGRSLFYRTGLEQMPLF